MPKTSTNHYLERHSAPPDTLVNLLAKANITINGDKPWDVQVYDERVYRDVLTRG